MTLKLVTGPVTLPISVPEMKSHLRIDHSSEDVLISDYITAALRAMERRFERAFEQQTWDLFLDGFPDGDIEIAKGPVQSVTSITYTDADDTPQTLAADAYVLDATEETSAVIVAADGWPGTASGRNTVTVRFVVGSGTPADVRHAIILLVSHWFKNREAVSESMDEAPLGVGWLTETYRVLHL